MILNGICFWDVLGSFFYEHLLDLLPSIIFSVVSVGGGDVT